MSLLSISKETLQGVIKLAIEKNDDKTLQTFITDELISLNDCIKLVTEAGKIELITILLKNVTNKSTQMEEKKVKVDDKSVVSPYRKIISTKFWILGDIVDGYQLLSDVYENPTQALLDLKNNIVSVEEINKKDDIFEWTALHMVCFYWFAIKESDQLVQELVNKGANINAKTLGGETPLTLILEAKSNHNSKRASIIQFLLAQPNIEFNMNLSLIHKNKTYCSLTLTKDNINESIINILIKKN